MPGPVVSAQEKSEWANFVIQEVVSFLGARKEEIYANYAAQSEGKLSRETIEEAGLMDFEIALTYLNERSSGLGRGFLGMNLIRERLDYTLKRNSITSPSSTTYSLPSARSHPLLRASAREPASSNCL